MELYPCQNFYSNTHLFVIGFVLGPTDPRRIPTRVPPTPGSGGRFVIPSLGGRYPTLLPLLLYLNISNNPTIILILVFTKPENHAFLTLPYFRRV